jgi:hypothetical protein
MKPAIILRVAALLALIQYAAHAFLFLSASPTHGAGEVSVIVAMKTTVAGLTRSYWDFYFGYGLMVILSGVIEMVSLWYLAALAKTEPSRVRPIVALFILANFVHAFLVWKYFALPVPIAFDIVIALVLSVAFVSARRQDA